MAVIRKIKNDGTTIYPITDASAVYYNANETLATILSTVGGEGSSLSNRIMQLLEEHEIMKIKTGLTNENTYGFYEGEANDIKGLSWTASAIFDNYGKFVRFERQEWTLYREGTQQNILYEISSENPQKVLELIIPVTNNSEKILLYNYDQLLGPGCLFGDLNHIQLGGNNMTVDFKGETFTSGQKGYLNHTRNWLIYRDDSDYYIKIDEDSGIYGTKVELGTELISFSSPEFILS